MLRRAFFCTIQIDVQCHRLIERQLHARGAALWPVKQWRHFLRQAGTFCHAFDDSLVNRQRMGLFGPIHVRALQLHRAAICRNGQLIGK